MLITGIISFYISKQLTKTISKQINKINYSKLSFSILVLLTVMILSVSNFWGLIVFLVSTLTGIYCISLGVKKSLMMGCLMIPTILFYLRI